MLDISVFGFLPNWASNDINLVLIVGINLKLWFISAVFDVSDSFYQFESISSSLSPRFMVWINLSTILVPLWSPAELVLI